MEMTRRRFLSGSAAAVLVAGTMASGKVFGANERIRVACIGINGQGKGHIENYLKLDDVEIVALCDVDKKVLEDRATKVAIASGKRPKIYTDMREVFADPDVDAVSFATPNHWHSLGAIWACKAGKDVYVEKPISHCLFEGRKLVEAAAKYGRIVQHGTQRRSEANWVRAMQRLKSGVIGDIYMARALCYKKRDSIGTGVDMEPPAHLDWSLWQGPAAPRQYRDYADKKNDRGMFVHYNWHWHWAYGGGDLANQGVHQMDVACWGMGKGFPVKVQSMGGRYGYQDEGETPNTLVSTFTYPNGTILNFEVRGRHTNDEKEVTIGNLFYGSDGYMAECDFYDKDGKKIPDNGEGKAEIDVDGNPFKTFLRAVKSRQQLENHATPIDGHISAGCCHLANIAYRVGSSLTFDPAAEAFTGAEADKANVLRRDEYPREEFRVPEEV